MSVIVGRSIIKHCFRIDVGALSAKKLQLRQCQCCLLLIMVKIIPNNKHGTGFGTAQCVARPHLGYCKISWYVLVLYSV